MSLALTIFLWTLVAAWPPSRRRAGLNAAQRRAHRRHRISRLIPRLAIGVLARAYLAEMLPQDLVHAGSAQSPECWAHDRKPRRRADAGGPVVGFSIGAAALHRGASAPQVIAYTTAWALFALPRILLYEFR